MRSHADEILGLALNDITGTLISIGKDSSIKVWHAETME
jgi:WD40 repeat protein